MSDSNAGLLTPREAAERLGVSYQTIKQYIYKGQIKTEKTLGGHHRIPLNALENARKLNELTDPSDQEGEVRFDAVDMIQIEKIIRAQIEQLESKLGAKLEEVLKSIEQRMAEVVQEAIENAQRQATLIDPALALSAPSQGTDHSKSS